MPDSFIPEHERETDTSIDSSGRVTRIHTESWIVESNTPKTTAQISDEMGFLPTDPHPYDPTTLIKSFKVKQIKHRNPWRYLITVSYSNNVPDRSQSQSDNPFDDPVDVEWDDSEFEQAIEKDRDGEAILLPTKRPFDPAIKMLVPCGRLTIVRNERLLDPDPGLNYRMRINSDSFAGKAAKTMLLKSIRTKQKTRNGIVYYEATWTWDWNPLGWDEEVLLQDTHRLNLFGEAIPILESPSKQRISDPVPITAAGAVIPKTSLPGAAEFKQIKKYKLASFGALGFPV